MDQNKTHDTDNAPKNAETTLQTPRRAKRHLIKTKWLRRTLKTLMWVFIVILMIPVLLYIPPVQTFVKNVACNFVYKSTGMKVEIGKFRLGFPLDVNLDNVLVLDQHADTMVMARKVTADVKLWPLLALDVKIKKLRLEDGYYRMVSPDSSMIMSVRAGYLDVDDKSEANMRTGEISLHKALLRNGNLQLYMDVWKQKQEPKDTAAASTPFLIKATDLQMENFSFAMSMLPTIDTLYLKAGDIRLKEGVVDLGKNNVSWKLASVANGNGAYITPTPEWAAAHPAPVSEPSDAPPMQIMGDSISLDNFNFIYATKGASPLPGFDASYISVSDIALGMRNFYNESSTVRLPITRLQAKERSGLQIVSGKGNIDVDSTGLALKDLDINTLYSYVKGSAGVPFALMELKPDAPVDVDVKARIGLPDVDAFMPALKEYTSLLPARNPLDVTVKANGSLASVDIPQFDATLRDVVNINASGYAANPLDIKKMNAHLDFEGTLSDPRVIDKFMGQSEIKVPAFHIEGTASAVRENYAADFDLASTAGNASGRGHVGMNSEKYDVDAEIEGLDVEYFMPSLGIGKVTASVKADGAGFNPLSGNSVTNASVHINSIEYNKRELQDIRADVILSPDKNFDLYAVSANPGLNFEVEGNGSIHPDDYVFDLTARLNDIDLEKLGMSKTMNNGKGTIYLKGTASPERWLYNADVKVNDFDWNTPEMFIHLPYALTAKVDAAENATSADIDSYLTSLKFRSPSGLKMITEAFSKVSDIAMRQIQARDLRMDSISHAMPPFTLSLNASGKGMLSQVLTPSGFGIDTIYGAFTKDSLFHGNLQARSLAKGTIRIDTLGLNITERRNLLDYRIHMGNRPGTMDEFAKVNLNGYVGNNRISAYLTQQNIQGKTGYKLGVTGAMQDSLVSVHLTPLKSMIAYMPWSINDDNFIDYNIYNNKIQANLQAQSAESSILLRTEPTDSIAPDMEKLHLKLDNIKIQDFLSMSMTAPPIKGAVNSDLTVLYNGKALFGKGTLGVKDLTYEKSRVGDFDFNLRAGMGSNGRSGINLGMLVNGKEALGAYARLKQDSVGLTPDSIGVRLTEFPLAIANPFLGNMATLAGALNGAMRMDGTFLRPILNGRISFDDASVYIPMAGCKLSFDTVPIPVDNSVISFNDFDIFGTNKNPIGIDGTVDATSFSNILLNLKANARNCQLVNSDKRSKADLFGKLFIDLDASVKGPLSLMDINANLNILGTTDVTYRLNLETSNITETSTQDVVKFVDFNDTTQVAKADSIERTSTMRINAALTISPGMQATVLLSNSGTDRLELEPTANLKYFQNYMGDMTLNGTFTLGNGFVRYNFPVLGEKKFTFDPASKVTWSGELMNPRLAVTATDNMKANLMQGSSSQMVNFIVTLKADGSLSSPKVTFDLATNDDLSIQNELQSMSADQRMTQAMNLLITGQYMNKNVKGNTNIGGMGTSMLYGYLEGQLNSWLAKNVRGVDLSFGVDQYDKINEGASSTQTSYSYQVSKSLFNNRFKIQVGGNYSTDASADENLSQNLISDISAEYILKQTETLNMAVKIFRHTGYESILEGEVTETGAGFVMKRKLDNLLHLFRFRRDKRKVSEGYTKVTTDSIPADTVKPQGIRKEDNNEK